MHSLSEIGQNLAGFLNEIVMNEATYIISPIQILRRKSGVLRVPQVGDEWNAKRRKDREIILKCISVCEMYSKYQLIKSIHKKITAPFLQKSIEQAQI